MEIFSMRKLMTNDLDRLGLGAFGVAKYHDVALNASQLQDVLDQVREKGGIYRGCDNAPLAE
jgi:hypothetical protein